MCVVSNVYDHYTTPLSPAKPFTTPLPPYQWPWGEPMKPVSKPVTKKEIDDFIEEFERLLKRAREWDIENNEPDCESADKKRRLQELADELGIAIDFPE
jgi:hypothetical protein